MVVPTIWIKNNMLYSGEQRERQLTEAELKVQRSLQKLSVPNWYLNKRSNPPKIVNVEPIEFRPASWKCSSKSSTINSTSSELSDVYPENILTNGTNTNDEKSTKPVKNTFEQQQSLSKYPRTNEPFDTWIPEMKLSANISKTFPKVSPSRKIQNINIVLPPGPKIDISNSLEKNQKIISNKYSNCNAYLVKKQSNDSNRKNEEPPCKKQDNVQKVVEVSVKTATITGTYRLRTSAAPKFTPANLFSSTVIEDSPKAKKNLSQGILEKSAIFENSFRSDDYSDFSIDRCQKPKKLSQNLLEKTFVFENSKADQSSRNFDDFSMNISNDDSCVFEKNIHSIEATSIEKNDTAGSALKSSFMVRDMVRRLEKSKNNNSSLTPQKTSTFNWETESAGQIKKSKFELKTPSMFQKKRFNLDKKSPIHHLEKEKPTQSPCTRFLNSNKKSTELENVVRSKQQTREKGVVQGLIEVLAAKVSQSNSPRKKQMTQVNHSYVKKVVNALENADKSKTEQMSRNREISVNEDTGSGSDCEFKSNTTSVSLKDTDSDSDRRTPSPNDDEDSRFDYTCLTTTDSIHQEDDSVYWIPVSRCKLPRTSSLMSIMSRLSSNVHSPCISPIRSEYEDQQAWGVTYRRTSSLSRKLFRIDETIVIDSGYSDKSDRSGFSSKHDDSNCSDTQYDSGSECRPMKMKKSSRRRSIVNNFYY